MPYQGLEVHLPALAEVPGMLERLADASNECRNYASDAFTIRDWRGSRVGLINLLTGTHRHIRNEVLGYFDEVRSFATAKSERVRESVELYRQRVYRELAEDDDPLLREIGQQLRDGMIRPHQLLAVPGYDEVIARGLERLQQLSKEDVRTAIVDYLESIAKDQRDGR